MEREDHSQTTPGEHPASPPIGRQFSTPLARLAPETPAARLLALASPAPLGPDATSSGEHFCFFLLDDLSGEARALPLIMGRAASPQCSNGSGGADHAHPFRHSRP